MKYFIAALVAAVLVAGPAFAQSSSSSSSSFSYCYGSLCAEELDAETDYICSFESYVGFNYENGWNPAYWPDWVRSVELRTYDRRGYSSNQPSWAIYDTDGSNTEEFHACEREDTTSDILDCGDFQVNTDNMRITHTDASPFLNDQRGYIVVMGIGTCEAR